MMTSPQLFVLERRDDESDYGFRLRHKPGEPHMIVDHVRPNSAAWRAGLQKDNLLLGVNALSILGKQLAEVSTIIKSAPGNSLALDCLADPTAATNNNINSNNRASHHEEDIYGNVELVGNNVARTSTSSAATSSSSTSRDSNFQKSSVPAENYVQVVENNNNNNDAARSPSQSNASRENVPPSNNSTADDVYQETQLPESRRSSSSSSSGSNSPDSLEAQRTTVAVHQQPTAQPEAALGSLAVTSSRVMTSTIHNSAAPPPSSLTSDHIHKKHHSKRFRTKEQPHPLIWHHLKKWQQFSGFGFAVKQTADGPLALVNIEENMPAYCSGIRDGMILCYVNTHNVVDMPIQDAAELIKNSGSEVRILVISKETWDWLARHDVLLDDCLSELRMDTHDPPPDLPTTSIPTDI